MRILLIEDDPDVLAMMEVVLTMELPGAAIASTSDASEAMRIARHECPDVVVLDSGVPGMSTEELAGELKDLLPSGKLVLYSALDRAALDERSKALGLPAFQKGQLRELLGHIRGI